MNLVRGSKPTTMVEIVKIKNDRPTIIKVFGNEYVLRPGAQFKGIKRGDNHNVSNR